MALNNAIRNADAGGGGGSVHLAMQVPGFGKVEMSYLNGNLSFPAPFQPTKSVFGDPYLKALWQNDGVRKAMEKMWYMARAAHREIGVVFYGTIQDPEIGTFVPGGEDYVNLATWGNTPIGHAHVHPYEEPKSGIRYFNGRSSFDRELAKEFNLPGFIVNWDSDIIGYGYVDDGLIYHDGKPF